MNKSRNTTERFVLRTLLWGLLGFALLIGLCIGGFRAVHVLRINRLTSRAEGFLAAGDVKSAALSARAALNADPDNLKALRVMADVSDRIGQRTAIDWRERVVAKVPDSANDWIALAKAALTFNEPAVAESALTRVREAGAKIPEYHEAMAELAIAKKDPAAAEKEFVQAVNLEPSNKNYQLNLAVFRVQSPDPAVRLQASKFLQDLLDDKAFRVPAARALLDYAIQRRDPAAIEIASLLLSYPEASFRERLRCAQIFRELNLDAYPTALTKLEDEAAADPQKAADLLSWLAESNQSTLALDWTKRLPDSVLNQSPVFIAVADCYIAAHDWGNLEKWCRTGDWKDLDFLRHAYLAYALKESSKPLDSDLEWSKAVQGASNGEELQALERDVSKWNWTERATEVLWRLAKDPDKAKPALAALYQHYSELSDTRNLYLVSSRSAQVAPDDLITQNNFAQLSLLLKVDLDNALKVAERVYQRDPRNPSFTSTYAFALLSNNRTRQALKVMSSLPEEQLRKPEIAAYYGIILSAAGEKDKAREYLEIGSKSRLLPEEKALVEKATARR